MSFTPKLRLPAATLAALALLCAFGCASGGSQTKSREAERLQAVAHYKIGVHHLSEGSIAMAIRELRVAEAKDPDDAWIHVALAEAYRRKAKVEEAEQHLRRALVLEPDFHQARLSLSGLLVQVGRFDEAIVEAQVLVDDPTFPAPWRALTNLGWAQFKLGRNGEARGNLLLALEYRRDFWPALLDLGILEAQEGHPLQAIKLFRRVLESNPGALAKAETNYRIAELYVSLGRREEAVAHLSAATEVVPGGTWSKRSEEYLELLR
jgi:Tfp pilus assembly protein PilF